VCVAGVMSCAAASAAYLSAVEVHLRKPVRRLDGDARAVVACIFRESGSNETGLEIFFILRAFDPKKSRWSGQVGFPGGHVESGETDAEAVVREVHEEVGLHLKSGHYQFLGELEQRYVSNSSGSRLVLCCHVFKQLEREIPSRVQVKEVAACGWAPFHSLTTDAYVKSLTWSSALTKNVNDMEQEENKINDQMNHQYKNKFPSILLPIEKDIIVAAHDVTESFIRSKFVLWGLTLGLLNDFLLSTKARSYPIDRSLLATIEEKIETSYPSAL